MSSAVAGAVLVSSLHSLGLLGMVLAGRRQPVSVFAEVLNGPELSISGLLVPWITTVGALGFLAAWLVVAILERTGLSRHLWRLPL